MHKALCNCSTISLPSWRRRPDRLHWSRKAVAQHPLSALQRRKDLFVDVLGAVGNIRDSSVSGERPAVRELSRTVRSFSPREVPPAHAW